MSLPYRATVFVNWLPVICMPSPESPAKRITALSITSGLVFEGGSVISVDMIPDFLGPKPHTRLCCTRDSDNAIRVTQKEYHSGTCVAEHTGQRRRDRWMAPKTARKESWQNW